MPGTPGSAHPLTPRSTTYVRTDASGDMSTVNSTVHVANLPPPSSRRRYADIPPLPQGHNYKELNSTEEIRKAKNFQSREYGSPITLDYPKSTKFYGIVGPSTNGGERPLVAVGEVNPFSWHTSELRHVVVKQDKQGQGFGKSILAYLEAKTTTPTAMLVSKLDSVRHIVNTNGFEKMNTTTSRSGNNLDLFMKVLDPSEEHENVINKNQEHVVNGTPEKVNHSDNEYSITPVLQLDSGNIQNEPHPVSFKYEGTDSGANFSMKKNLNTGDDDLNTRRAQALDAYDENPAQGAQAFIKDNYGARGVYSFAKGAMYHSLSSENHGIEAMVESNRIGWWMTEVKHLTVPQGLRHKGRGEALLQQVLHHIGNGTAMGENARHTSIPKTTAAIFASRTPQVKLMAKKLGCKEVANVKGPSGHNVSIFLKTLRPSE